MWFYSKCRDQEVKNRLAVMLQTGFYPNIKTVQESGIDSLSLDIETQGDPEEVRRLIKELQVIPYIREVKILDLDPPKRPPFALPDEVLKKILL